MGIASTEKAVALFSTRDVMTAIRAPRIVDSRGVHEQLDPILALVSQVQQQVVVHRQQLLTAEMRAEDGDATRATTERFHQTLGHIELQTKAIVDAARSLALAFRQLERYGSDVEQQLTAIDAAAAAAAAAFDAAAPTTSAPATLDGTPAE